MFRNGSRSTRWYISHEIAPTDTLDTDQNKVRLCSIPVPSILLLVGAVDAACTICYLLGLKTPIRLSSLPRGQKFRPGTYFIIEDIVAVDGGAGLRYRMALDKRYEQSPEFRRMLAQLGLFWSISAIVGSIVLLIIMFAVPPSVAFGLGNSLRSHGRQLY